MRSWSLPPSIGISDGGMITTFPSFQLAIGFSALLCVKRACITARRKTFSIALPSSIKRSLGILFSISILLPHRIYSIDLDCVLLALLLPFLWRSTLVLLIQNCHILPRFQPTLEIAQRNSALLFDIFVE